MNIKKWKVLGVAGALVLGYAVNSQAINLYKSEDGKRSIDLSGEFAVKGSYTTEENKNATSKVDLDTSKITLDIKVKDYELKSTAEYDDDNPYAYKLTHTLSGKVNKYISFEASIKSVFLGDKDLSLTGNVTNGNTTSPGNFTGSLSLGDNYDWSQYQFDKGYINVKFVDPFQIKVGKFGVSFAKDDDFIDKGPKDFNSNITFTSNGETNYFDASAPTIWAVQFQGDVQGLTYAVTIQPDNNVGTAGTKYNFFLRGDLNLKKALGLPYDATIGGGYVKVNEYDGNFTAFGIDSSIKIPIGNITATIGVGGYRFTYNPNDNATLNCGYGSLDLKINKQITLGELVGTPGGKGAVYYDKFKGLDNSSLKIKLEGYMEFKGQDEESGTTTLTLGVEHKSPASGGSSNEIYLKLDVKF